MGLRYRKSINLGGGFRINLSKSGVGYSWGTKGFRYTKTASGRTRKTYTIPGTGISHVTEKKNVSNSNRSPVTSADSNAYDVQKIENSNIKNFQDDEYSEFLIELKRIIRLDTFTNLLCLTIVLAFSLPILWITFILGVICKIYLHINAHIDLNYEMDDYSEYLFKERHDAWLSLLKSNKIWSKNATSKVKNKKIAAGASNLIKRTLIKKNKKIPYYLKCNVDIFCIGLEKEKLYFLPDKILIIKNGNPGVIPYNDVKFEYTETNFIETDSVPSDTQIIKYTWKFVNKNGKPDKRYKNNKQIPICKYGEISITSNTGLNTVLLVSNSEKALEFVSMMKTIQQYIEEQENI